MDRIFLSDETVRRLEEEGVSLATPAIPPLTLERLYAAMCISGSATLRVNANTVHVDDVLLPMPVDRVIPETP